MNVPELPSILEAHLYVAQTPPDMIARLRHTSSPRQSIFGPCIVSYVKHHAELGQMAGHQVYERLEYDSIHVRTGCAWCGKLIAGHLV